MIFKNGTCDCDQCRYERKQLEKIERREKQSEFSEVLNMALAWADNATLHEFPGVSQTRNRVGTVACPLCYFQAELIKNLKSLGMFDK